MPGVPGVRKMGYNTQARFPMTDGLEISNTFQSLLLMQCYQKLFQFYLDNLALSQILCGCPLVCPHLTQLGLAHAWELTFPLCLWLCGYPGTTWRMERRGLYGLWSWWEILLQEDDHKESWEMKDRPRTPGTAFDTPLLFFFGILFLLINVESITTLQSDRGGVLTS